MQPLTQAVRSAQRRLWMNRWFTSIGWLMLAAAALFIIAVIVERCWLIAEDAWRFYAMVGGILAVAVLAGSLIWSLLTAESKTLAAAKLDAAAGTAERISSSLYCESSQSPFAQAVVADAQQRCAALNVRQYLPLRWPRSGSCAGGGFGVALLVLWLFPELNLASRQTQVQQQERNEAVKRTESRVRPVLDEAMARIADRLPELKTETPQAPPASAPAQTPLDVQRQAIRQIQQVQAKLDNMKRTAQQAGIDEFKKLMRQLQTQAQQGKSQVQELSKALAQGDFKAAQEAIAALQAELKAQSTPQDQQKAKEIQAQLKELSAKLQKIAENEQQIKDKLTSTGMTPEALNKALEALRDKDTQGLMEQLAAQGLTPAQAQQLASELQQMNKGAAAASQLASSLKQAAGSDSQGQSLDSMEGFTSAGDQLSEMEAAQQELQDLQASMNDLNQAKDKIGGACSACQGTGQCNSQACSACQGTGQGPGSMASQSGMGAQAGQGQGGVAQRQETAIGLNRERPPVNTVAGNIISQKFVDGEQFKGEVSQGFVETSLSAEHKATESIAREHIPRQYHSAIREYFKRSRPNEAQAPAANVPETSASP